MNMIEKSISFHSYLDLFEKSLTTDLETFGKSSRLKEALEYSLKGEAKRVRPLIVYLVAEALNKSYNVNYLALSVEYFHTSSLIADDLPCMDNDKMRREKPALHIAFGETTALLASYALISAAFEKIFQGSAQFSLHCDYHDKACAIALKEASFASGIHGATGGQYLDLYQKKPTLKEIKEIIEKKTITLFCVSFLFGWIFGGGDLKQIDYVKSAAYDFGMAFQLSDDICDLEQDKDKKRYSNIALLLGVEETLQKIHLYLESFHKTLSFLSIESISFHRLTEKMLKYIKK